MKIVRITTLYPAYVRQLYAARPELERLPYAEQARALAADFHGLSDSWSQVLPAHGHELTELTINVVGLQRAWAREHGLRGDGPGWLDDVCVDQVRRAAPDAIWYDDYDRARLRRLRAAAPSVRWAFGHVGSALPATDVWPDLDFVLSCADEAVELLRARGVRARQLHHAFDPRIQARLGARPSAPAHALSFVGQIVRGHGFHRERQALLEALADLGALTIFSSEAGEELGQAARALWMAARLRDRTAAVTTAGALLQRLRRHVTLRRLVPRLRPAVFGMRMYQTLHASQMTLNIHADSSPRFASNMRLFETTGVGTCLVTDARDNLPQLFDVDREIVVYRSAAECREKIAWLLEHPEACARIGQAGQARTLARHSFAARAPELAQILVEECRG
jgi:spore maturation protein CgeB